MAAETSVKPSMANCYDDEDDEPLVFRRSSNSASNHNQSNTNAQRSKMVPPSKPSSLKSPLVSPNASTSTAKVSSVKSPTSSVKASSLKSPTSSVNVSSAKPPTSSVNVSSSKPPTSSGKVSSVRPPTSSGKASSAKPPNSSAKVSSVKSPTSSSSSAKASSMKSPVSSTSLDHHSKQSVKEEQRKVASDLKGDDVDSEDDMPLCSRLKGNSSQPNKKPSTPKQETPRSHVPLNSGKSILSGPATDIKRQLEESDDEAPISSSISAKSKAGTSGIKPDEKKPLVSKVHQNGIKIKDERQNSQASIKRPLDKPNHVMSAKRPLEKGNSSDQSLAKKPKLASSSPSMTTKQVIVKAERVDDKKRPSNTSISMKTKQESVKAEHSDDDDDDNVPIAKRMKSASDIKSSSTAKKVTKVISSSSKKVTSKSKQVAKNSKYSKSSKELPSGDGQQKWTTLVHNGVIFPPPYKPHGVKILYKGKPVNLTPEQEEVATMFAVMRDTDYYSKPKFRENFWNDWKRLLGKNHVIQSLDECDFDPIFQWHLEEKEKKKQMTSEEKKALKEEKLKLEDKYMWAILDGVKERVGNFRVEPPGLFRGRGEHPKMGKLKKRIFPSDITINIGKDAPIPECPIAGERWKEIKHDRTVTWLAFWNDPINPKEFKYVFLAASSALKGQSDKEKYEKARKLKDYIKNIRTAYTKDFTCKDDQRKQIAVATYLIDKLALRAGNEKDDDEADTVGCCTLKVGNVECIPPNKLKFDFLGKDSIQYVNTVEVEPPVYKAIGEFQSKKKKTDDLFDELDTSKLNAHLKELMPGLTAKVFRTYNASITLDDMLSRETKEGEVAHKIVTYNLANKEVAIICNHQRSISKSHGPQIERLNGKIEELKGVLKELKTDLDRARKGKPPLKDSDGKNKRNLAPEALEKKISQTNAKIEKMERDLQTKEDLKTVALGTSKINYLDPRITVAWCKRHEVPIEKMFNKSLIAKFSWAMDVDPDFRF